MRRAKGEVDHHEHPNLFHHIHICCHCHHSPASINNLLINSISNCYLNEISVALIFHQFTAMLACSSVIVVSSRHTHSEVFMQELVLWSKRFIIAINATSKHPAVSQNQHGAQELAKLTA
jgi:hypothetical protein